MIVDGIAARGQLQDDRATMMNEFAPRAHDNGSGAFALCEAAALATRTQALLDELRQRLGAFVEDTRPLHWLTADEREQLGELGEEVAELTSQIAHVVEGLPLEPLAVSEQEIAGAARAALAHGIVDERRALTAASFLTADEGLPALADALVCSDAHAFWTARVVDVLAAFRDVDEQRARAVAANAGVAETARFCELAPERVLVLAQVALQHVAR
jgi:hypothetical protein